MIATMKKLFGTCLWGWFLVALPGALQAQVQDVKPEYPPLETGSPFIYYALLVLFTLLVLLITFRVPKRNAIEAGY